ncbi:MULTISPECIES: hypothetical protein [unclassified Labrenzia]|uniref:hypothetical protein n=1 Tax=unclassified Labrenzia TaxID=2648686 RepID=UPI001268942D|nr:MULTISPECIES: hypothetical protein [unclassified Labrenzia]
MARKEDAKQKDQDLRQETAAAGEGEGGEASEAAPEPLTQDLSVWAGFRAQRSAARALADDQDAPCLTLQQCASVSFLVRKSPACPAAAMLKHLELVRDPFDGEKLLALFLVETFRSVLLQANHYQSALEAAAAPAPERRRRKVALDETTLELADEPFALTEVARKLTGR